jgi:hypothetical protein
MNNKFNIGDKVISKETLQTNIVYILKRSLEVPQTIEEITNSSLYDNIIMEIKKIIISKTKIEYSTIHGNTYKEDDLFSVDDMHSEINDILYSIKDDIDEVANNVYKKLK